MELISFGSDCWKMSEIFEIQPLWWLEGFVNGFAPKTHSGWMKCVDIASQTTFFPRKYSNDSKSSKNTKIGVIRMQNEEIEEEMFE